MLQEGQRGSSSYFLGLVIFFFFVSYFIPCFTVQILYSVALEFQIKILILIVIFVLKIDFLFSLAIMATMATDLRASTSWSIPEFTVKKKKTENVAI